MKQVFLILFLSLSSLQLSAQELKVESFNILDKDLDASVYYPKEDMTTGNKAAIIKVVTSETGAAVRDILKIIKNRNNFLYLVCLKMSDKMKS